MQEVQAEDQGASVPSPVRQEEVGLIPMAVLFRQFDFACPPLTEGDWVRSRLVRFAERLPWQRGFKDVHEPFSSDQPERLRVSMVRHPLAWLELAFGGSETMPHQVRGLFQQHRLNWVSWELFVKSYLRSDFLVGDLYGRYQADTVMRVEDLPWCLVEFADSLGAGPEVRDCLTTEPCPGYRHKRSDWDALGPNVRRLALEREREVCERYDYW